MEIIEQIKSYLLKQLEENLTHMYEYGYKDNMHSVYHGMVIAIQDILRAIIQMTTEVTKKGGEQ